MLEPSKAEVRAWTPSSKITKSSNNYWKKKKNAQSGLATETILLLYLPAGHRQTCKGILVKPTKTSFYSGRTLGGPVYDGAPTEHEHGEMKYLINLAESSDSRVPTSNSFPVPQIPNHVPECYHEVKRNSGRNTQSMPRGTAAAR